MLYGSFHIYTKYMYFKCATFYDTLSYYSRRCKCVATPLRCTNCKINKYILLNYKSTSVPDLATNSTTSLNQR